MDETILLARVLLLERLVRALMKDRFLAAPDPVSAADSYADRFLATIEQSLDESAPKVQIDVDRIILTEQINEFFDLLKHDVRLTLKNRGS